MCLFVANLVFEVIIDGHHDHFDEQLHLLRAEDRDDAVNKAIMMGKGMSGTFNARYNAEVCWQFVAVSGIYSAEEEQSLLVSFTKYAEEPSMYRKIQLLRQENLRVKSLKLA